jgi:hypothetical protein
MSFTYLRTENRFPECKQNYSGSSLRVERLAWSNTSTRLISKHFTTSSEHLQVYSAGLSYYLDNVLYPTIHRPYFCRRCKDYELYLYSFCSDLAFCERVNLRLDPLLSSFWLETL